MVEPEQLMQQAIAMCRTGIARGQSPFGCAIAIEDEVIACCHNTVLQSIDITAHAEVNALRAANRTAGSILLPRAIVATTCEPCPMCMAALHWARVERVYFGAEIEDAKRAGFNELQLPARQLLQMGGSSLELVGGVLSAECRALFDEWGSAPDARPY